MAKENSSWGYDRIVGALANLGHTVSDQTVGNILKRHGVAPAPDKAHHELGGIHSSPPGRAGGDGLLYGGGSDAARAGDVLGAVFHPSREP